MNVTYLRPIRLRYLPVSYGIKDGKCEVGCICRSEEGCSSVTSFWQRKDEYMLELLLLLAIGSSSRLPRYTHPKCVVSYWADVDNWDGWAAGRKMRPNISYNIFPEQ